MKMGLLLLQSIGSSALRSGGRSSCASVRHWSKGASRHTGASGAAFLAATAAAGVGLVGADRMGASTVAMCSSNDNHASVTTSINGSASPAASVAAITNGRKKYIDEPDKDPEHNPLLPFPESSLRHDTYSGVTLDLTTLTPQQQTVDGSASTSAHHSSITDADTFHTALSKALEIWSLEKRRGLWLKIPTTHSHLISSATQLGFDFQHAEPGYCVLTKWLPKESASRLPNGPTHQVGIGALVVHPTSGKMLAVQERTGPAAKRKLWKMPTGLTDPGEDIAVAAVRELKEETGLDCVFDKIICIRQAHGGLFNRSDMFFVCLCKLDPKYEEGLKQGRDIELIPQEEEILMADWIDMDFYSHQGVWSESPLYKEMNGAMLKVARKGIEYSASSGKGESLNGDDGESHGFVAKNLPVGFRPGSNTIYVSSKL